MLNDLTRSELEIELQALREENAALQQQLAAIKAPDEIRIRDLFAHSPLAYQSLDEQGRYLYLNQALAKMLGYAPQELLGRAFSEVWAPEKAPGFPQAFDCLKRDRSMQAELELVKKDGSRQHVILSGIVQNDSAGRFVCTHCFLSDINSQKSTEAVLRAEQEKLTGVINTVPGAICSFKLLPDGSLAIPYASPAFEEIYGLTPAEVFQSARPLFERIPAGELPQLMHQVQESAKSLQPWHNEYSYMHPVKGLVWIEGYSVPVRDAQVGVTWHGFATDITTRRQAQNFQRRYDLLARYARDKIFFIRREDGRILDANAAAVSGYGYSREELLQLKIYDLLFPVAEGIEERVRQMDAEHIMVEREHRRKDGSTFPVEVSAQGAVMEGVPILISVVRDMSERRKVQKALEESEKRYRVIFDGVREGIMAVSFDRKLIAYANPAICAMFAYPPEEFIKLTREDLFASPADHKQLMSPTLGSGRGGQPITRVVQCRRKDGSLFYAEIRASRVELDAESLIISFFSDVTERRQNEALLQARLWLGNISPQLSVGELLQVTLDQAELISDSQAGFFHLVEDDQVRFEPPPGGGPANPPDQAGLWAESLRTHRAQVCNDAAGLPNLHTPLKRFISVPVERNGRIVAVIGVADRQTDYLPQDVEAVTLLASEAWDLVLRLQAETARRESEEKFRSLLECQESAISTLDSSGVYHYANRIAAVMLGEGEAPEKIVGRSMAEFFPPAVVDYQMQHVRQVLKSGVGMVNEARSIVIGRPVWFRTSIQPIRNAEGVVTLAMVNAVDITGLKEAGLLLEEKVNNRTAEIEAVRQRLELATRAAGLGIWDWDLKTDHLDWDEQMFRVYNVKPGDFGHNNSSWMKYVHADDIASVLERAAAAARREADYDTEFRIFWPDGSVHYIKANAITLYDENGQAARMIGVNYDITYHKEAQNVLRGRQEMLRQTNDALERAMRMKDEFLASMSHELRTPLTSILGFSEALQVQTYGALNEKQARALANIESSGRHLLELINDVLDVSKIEAGKLELQPERCELRSSCLAGMQMVKGLAQQKDLHLDFSMHPEKMECVLDTRRLKQILVNLLGNAIKFTPRGGAVGLEVEGDRQQGLVRLTVWDTGIGINARELDNLFQPFVQVDSSLARQHSGTGLGLVLVKRLADLHGGRVEVQSEPGKGSRFSVFLPWLSELPQAPAADGAGLVLPGGAPGQNAGQGALVVGRPAVRVVLVVDDNQVNRSLIADYLETKNFRALQARSGQECLDQVPLVHPDLVLMDIQMPDMDGLETIRRIRAHPERAISGVPVIATTALAMSGDYERCLAAGANAYLSKPIGLLELLKTVNDTLAKKAKN